MSAFSHTTAGAVARPRWFWPAVAALIAVLAVVQVASIRQESQTWDEAIELATGYHYLKTGDLHFHLEHPPLAEMLAALPLLAMNTTLPDNAPNDELGFGQNFVYSNRVPADALLFAGRLTSIAITCAFALLLAWWTRRKFGTVAAIIALALFVFDPTMIAHGRYIKSDVLFALLSFLCVIAWVSYVERPRATALVATGVALGLATACKFSAVFLFPTLLLLGLRLRWRGVRAWAASTAIAAVVVLCFYAPEAPKLIPMSHNGRLVHADWQPLRMVIRRDTFAGDALAWIGSRLGWRDHSLFLGLAQLAAEDKSGQPAFLFGELSLTGWWYYFPAAFIVKTPTATLAAIGLALVLGLMKWRRPNFLTLALLLPMAIYMATAMTSHINIGLRHLLPIYPFLFVLVGATLAAWNGKRKAVVLGVLGAALLVESLAIYPHYLAFFNVLSGGPSNGPSLLVDSNLDWGQDVKKLKRYMDQHAIPRVCIAYFGTADLTYNRVSFDWLANDRAEAEAMSRHCVLAVSATLLEGVYLADDSFAWLRERQPTARVGYSIYVYDLRTAK